jgi:hypothetical protein
VPDPLPYSVGRQVDQAVDAAELVGHVVVGLIIVEPGLVAAAVAELVPPAAGDLDPRLELVAVRLEQRLVPVPPVEVAGHADRPRRVVLRQHEPQLDLSVLLGPPLDHRRARCHSTGSGPTPATVADLDPADLRTLLATPPTSFVAARNALVKALRAAKDRDSAATVAAIRRPAWPDWALNVTSQTHPDAIDAFAAAATAVREAQEAAIDGRTADVRPALNDLRQRTAAVVSLANAALEAEGRHGEVPEVMAKLSDVAASAEAVERLRGGTLGTDDAGGSALFAGLPPTPRPDPEAKASGSTPTPARAADHRAADPPAPAAAERRQLMRDLAAAERDLKRSQRTASRAKEDVAEAAQAAAHAEERLRQAQERLDTATAALERDEAVRAAAAAALDATS